MSITDIIDELTDATAIINGVANGAVDEVIPSDQGDLITMATANRDILAALSDITDDVIEVDVAKNAGLISIQADVDEVGEAALNLAALIQPVGSIVEYYGSTPNESLKPGGTILTKADYSVAATIIGSYNPTAFNLAVPETTQNFINFSTSNVTDLIYSVSTTTDENLFIAVGDIDPYSASGISGSSRCMLASKDGFTWERVGEYENTSNDRELNAVYYEEISGNYLAVGTYGLILVSSDGISWTERTPDGGYTTFGDDFNGIASDGDDIIVIVGRGGEIQTSINNGSTWVQQTAAGSYTSTFEGIAYGNGVFVAVGQGIEIQTSPDGITWTQRTSAATTSPLSIVYAQDYFVACLSTNNQIIISTNGITWELKTLSFTITTIAFAGDYFFGISDDSVYVNYDINDDTKWTQVDIVDSTSTTVFPIAYDGTNYVGFSGQNVFHSKGLWAEVIPTLLFTSQTSAGGVPVDFFSSSYSPDDSRHLLVGEIGTIQTSDDDGITWVARTADASYSNNFFASVYALSQFVIVGLSGEIQTSPDGITWTQRTNAGPDTNNYSCITYGGGLYVLGGSFALDLRKFQTSPDGITWTYQVCDTPTIDFMGFKDIVYGNSLFVAVATYGGLQTSEDAFIWTARTNATATTSDLNGITYSDVLGLYVLVGANGTIQSSTDGITWVSRTPALSYSGIFYSVTYSNGLFIAVGSLGVVQISTNGADWTQLTYGGTEQLRTVIYETTILSAGYTGTVVTAETEFIGRISNTYPYPDDATFVSFQDNDYADDVYMIVGSGGNIQRSTDGDIWTRITTGFSNTLYGIAIGDVVVAVGTGGHIIKSDNGIGSWTLQTPDDSYVGNIYSICYGDGAYVFVGSFGEIQSSSDGVTWSTRTATATYTGTFTNVEYVNTHFMAVGTLGMVQTSPDGFTWTERTVDAGFTGTFFGSAYGNGIYIIVGDSGEIQISSDAIIWEKQTGYDGSTNNFSGIAFGGGIFLASETFGNLQYSIDGVNWYELSGTGIAYNSMNYGDGKFISGGNAEWIRQTKFLEPFDTDLQLMVPDMPYPRVGFTNYMRVI